MKVLVVVLIATVRALTIVQLLGLAPLMQDLAKLSTAVENKGEATAAYMLDPNIHTFLKQYKTRTQFCDYKCRNFFDVPCFLLFGCNIHIRNFILIFFFPLFILSLTGLCCGKGIWTFSCWLHYLATFTGIRFVVAAIKYCAGDDNNSEIEEIKERRKIEENINQQQIIPHTASRMGERQSNAQSEQ